MINYNWKRPDKFYIDVIEHFGYKVNFCSYTYTNVSFNDNQEKIIQYIEDKDPFNIISSKLTCMNIILNINYEGKNMWLFREGFVENNPFMFPSSLL